MLDQIDLTKKMSKEVYQEQMEKMESELAALQRECKALGIPVILVFEGLDASGKGVQINKLIHPLDPRGFEVHAIKEETEEERMHPFLWRFWTKTPEKGRIAIFDTSWYRKVSIERFEHKMSREDLAYAYQEISTFERALADDGNVLMKFFLHISQKEQRKRFDKMLHSKETAWKVSKEDEKRNKEYRRYKEICEEMLERTESEYAPWILIEAEDRRFATAKIFAQVIRQLKERILQEKVVGKPSSQSSEIQVETIQKNLMESSVLSKVDLTLAYTEEV